MEVLQGEVDMIKGMGVEIKLNTPIGTDVTFAGLRDDYDAVFLGVGAPARASSWAWPARTASNVMAALDYLQDVSLGKETGQGDKVIGGGRRQRGRGRGPHRLSKGRRAT